MSVFLKGLYLQFYRGIGPEAQRLAPFKTFNFFIGANNAGKSIVLNFLAHHLSAAALPVSKEVQEVEVYRGAKTGSRLHGIGIPQQRFVQNIIKGADGLVQAGMQHTIEVVSAALADHGMIWVIRDQKHDRLSYMLPSPGISSVLDNQGWRAIWNRLTGSTGGGLHEHWVPDTLRQLLNFQHVQLPTIRLIPAKRQIGPAGDELTDLSGKGLIDRLAEIQSPDHDKRQDRQDFDKINSFVQSITGEPEARIEIPHHRLHVLVHMNDKVLPLSSLGTGIHEVIMIAAFCTIHKKQILCIEEPEIHLHPIIQRKLIRYLQTFTDNQYFIATHSPSFIDTPDAAVFHVTNDGDQTRIGEALLRSARLQICVDLGYRASDIVQANFIIWVEGPSDRIYIKHWISSMDPDLDEGIHYSIMFYGGRLLSHLDADSDEINEFIALRSLNQNLAIVMDSDKKSVRSKINDTKTRLHKQLSTGRGIAWVTKGREIENYVPHSLLQAAVRDKYAKVYSRPSSGGQFDHALYFERSSPKATRGKKALKPASGVLIEKDVDKVAVARSVCKEAADFSMLDLQVRVREIVKAIREAND